MYGWTDAAYVEPVGMGTYAWNVGPYGYVTVDPEVPDVRVDCDDGIGSSTF